MNFEQLQLAQPLLRGIADMGFTELTPVQEKTLGFSLAGRDIAVQSQTGTGKTAAFLITIFQRQQAVAAAWRKALIIAPTRELAVQIEAEAKLIGRHLNLKVGSFYGGVGYNRQEALLKRGVDIMVGTPGRLLDLEQKGTLSMRNVGFLVIDEADRLFDMGFLPDIRKILRRVSAMQYRQTMLFSATLSAPALQIAREYMNQPEKISVTPENMTVDTITQELYHVGSREKINLLLGILKRDNPRSVLFFTNMKCDAERLSRRLELNGFPNEFLTGDLAQSRRLRIIDDFKSGKVLFMVATDVAGRGLHIEGLDMVVNYDLPGESENYVHRIGRTARAGKSGKAVTLACEKYIANLEGIEKLINAKIPVVFPEDDMFLRDRSRGHIFKPRSGAPASRPRSGQQRTSQQRSGRPRTGSRPRNHSRSENRKSY
ncbi:MAG: DEAD/DEAH box helicase [Candidatus Aminicenantes bacterium]|nr:DEAD/DEAH box helicase [Acidobacteriota bacterium]MCG2809877.1 DEAD/DEAH box helicase [Candidatus Aminicenantes bacterium]